MSTRTLMLVAALLLLVVVTITVLPWINLAPTAMRAFRTAGLGLAVIAAAVVRAFVPGASRDDRIEPDATKTLDSTYLIDLFCSRLC